MVRLSLSSNDALREEAQKWMSGILKRKPSLKIGLYGSYYPPGRTQETPISKEFNQGGRLFVNPTRQRYA